MSNITFYQATLQDVPILVKNRVLFATELAGHLEESLVLALTEQMTRYFSKAVVDNSCISFIGKVNDEIAGIGSVHCREMPGNAKNPSGKWGYIMNMYTVPKYRRMGICKGILNELVEAGTRQGITGFELHATEEGEKVYKQEGFIQHNEPTYRKFVKR